MGPKKRTKFHEDVADEDQWHKIVNEEEQRLVVVDVFLDWCGPCQCMIANYPGIWFKYDDPEVRISFWHANEKVLPQELKEQLKLDVSPRFLIYHKGELKQEIKGARYVDLENAIDEYIPRHDED